MAVKIFVPDLPEFNPLVEAARKVEGCVVEDPVAGYVSIVAPLELRFERKRLGLGPALWNSALTGGFTGTIEEYDRDILRIVNADDA